MPAIVRERSVYDVYCSDCNKQISMSYGMSKHHAEIYAGSHNKIIHGIKEADAGSGEDQD